MKNPKIISHRGRSDMFPENTLESISLALITSDFAEFDVMLTKDN
jgi:glycerophosphoryl diester phosphodiesterase